MWLACQVPVDHMTGGAVMTVTSRVGYDYHLFGTVAILNGH